MLVKTERRLQRKKRVKAQISGINFKHRLSIYRSNINIYAQIIDDISGKTLCCSSDLKFTEGTKSQRAVKVGEDIAKKAKSLNINEIVFDRDGFAYHGRVKALADGARSVGLKF